MWEEHWDLSKPDKMAECLARHLSNADVKNVMEGANTPESKKKLNNTTQKALDTGGMLSLLHSVWLKSPPTDCEKPSVARGSR